MALAHGGDYIAKGINMSQWSKWLSNDALTVTTEDRLLPIIPARENHDRGPHFNEVFLFPPGDSSTACHAEHRSQRWRKSARLAGTRNSRFTAQPPMAVGTIPLAGLSNGKTSQHIAGVLDSTLRTIQSGLGVQGRRPCDKTHVADSRGRVRRNGNGLSRERWTAGGPASPQIETLVPAEAWHGPPGTSRTENHFPV